MLSGLGDEAKLTRLGQHLAEVAGLFHAVYAEGSFGPGCRTAFTSRATAFA